MIVCCIFYNNYSELQVDGANFLDNCIFEYWKDVDAVLDLSTTELPPEVTDDVGYDNLGLWLY